MSETWNNIKSRPFPESGWKPPETTPYLMPKDRPLGERKALLWMRRGALVDKVMQAMREVDTPPPRVGDFAPLVTAGYASRDGYFHRLTAIGCNAADEVVTAFARQLGIHHFIIGGSSRFSNSMRCTCGRTFHHAINEGHWESKQVRMQVRHLAEVEAVTARGEVYIAPELMTLRLVESSPPIAPEE